ncbi:hypothetical protein TNCV_4774801 [Trichonephila clavipes]|uniref:Uncharacterized protein n=1 Tax=Trichonephila clavipes TaxID=2585209 RepID=A0A8X6RB94_TRICX|nr:hypothetical protein TNCV_4774801 [Trichonephila clavipes]
MKRATAKTKRFCPESRRKGEKEKPLSEQCPRRGQKTKEKRHGTKVASGMEFTEFLSQNQDVPPHQNY